MDQQKNDRKSESKGFIAKVYNKTSPFTSTNKSYKKFTCMFIDSPHIF